MKGPGSCGFRHPSSGVGGLEGRSCCILHGCPGQAGDRSASRWLPCCFRHPSSGVGGLEGRRCCVLRGCLGQAGDRSASRWLPCCFRHPSSGVGGLEGRRCCVLRGCLGQAGDRSASRWVLVLLSTPVLGCRRPGGPQVLCPTRLPGPTRGRVGEPLGARAALDTRPRVSAAWRAAGVVSYAAARANPRTRRPALGCSCCFRHPSSGVGGPEGHEPWAGARGPTGGRVGEPIATSCKS